jgi:hypothetical protein
VIGGKGSAGRVLDRHITRQAQNNEFYVSYTEKTTKNTHDIEKPSLQ